MDNATRKEIDALLAITRECLRTDIYMPVSTLSTLLEIAKKEGRSYSELAEATGFSLPTLSRQIGLLSDYSSTGKDSFGFVKSEHPVDDRRTKVVTMTPAGRACVTRLLKCLG